MFDWKTYINATANKHPRNLLVRALTDFCIHNRESALDLGAGALNDSKYLLEQGFKQVVAVDREDNSNALNSFDKQRFIFKKQSLENYSYPPNSFDLINAQYVLSFVSRDIIPELIKKINKSLKIGGLFVGQFFGPRDSWSNQPGVHVYTRDEVEGFLASLEILYLQEEEKDQPTVIGEDKHWHIFHFVAKKNN